MRGFVAVVAISLLGVSSEAAMHVISIGGMLSNDCDTNGTSAEPIDISRTSAYTFEIRSMLPLLQFAERQVNGAPQCGIEVEGEKRPVRITTFMVPNDDISVMEAGMENAIASSMQASKLSLGPVTGKYALKSIKASQAAGGVAVMAPGNENQHRAYNQSFGLLPRQRIFFKHAFDMLEEKQAKTVVRVIQQGVPVPRQICSGVPAEAALHGMKVLDTIETPLNPTPEEAIRIAKQVAALNADIVVTCMFRNCQTWLAATEEANLNPKAHLISGCLTVNEARDEAAAKQAAYFLNVLPLPSELPVKDGLFGWSIQDLSAISLEEMGEPASNMAARTIAALSIMLQAVHHANSTEPEAIVRAVKEGVFQTLAGVIQFDEDGMRMGSNAVTQHNSQLETTLLESAEQLIYPMPTWAWKGCTYGRNCSGHGRCLDTGRCQCEEGFLSFEDACVVIPVEERGYNSSLAATCIVMSVLVILLSLACIGWMLVYKDSQVVRASQRRFLFLIALGSILSGAAIPMLTITDENDLEGLALTGDYVPANFGCWAVTYLYTSGFVLSFGPLAAKTWRLHKLVGGLVTPSTKPSGKANTEEPTLKRVKISNALVMGICLAILFVDLVLVSIWKAIAPLYYKRTVTLADEFGNPVTSYGACTSDTTSMPFIFAIFSFHLALLGVANYMCYRTRMLSTAFSEGKYVAMASVSNLQLLVLSVPILFIVSDDPVASMFVRAGVIMLETTSTLLFVFVPKIIMQRKGIEVDITSKDSNSKRKSNVTVTVTEAYH